MTDRILDINEGEFEKILKEEEKLFIVQFYTTTCPNCAAIAPTFAQLSGELYKNAVFTKVNAEVNQKLTMRFGVLGVPTFKFFCSGRPVGELVGSINATLLRNTIKDLIRHKSECITNSTPLTYEMDGFG